MPEPLDPWSTVQLVPPGPNSRFAGFVHFADLSTEVLAVDYLALQELVTKSEDDDDDDEVQSRVVPVVVDATGQLLFLEAGTAGNEGLACLAPSEAACHEFLGKLLAELRSKLAAAPAAVVPTPADVAAAEPATPAAEGTPDAS